MLHFFNLNRATKGLESNPHFFSEEFFPTMFTRIFVYEPYHASRKRALEKRYLTAAGDGIHDMDVFCANSGRIFWSTISMHKCTMNLGV